MGVDINSVDDFDEWISATLDLLHRVNAGTDGVASDHWSHVWEDACGFADALGLRDAVESIGGPIRGLTYVCEKDGKYDYDTPEKAIRDQLELRLNRLRKYLLGGRRKYQNTTWARVHRMLDDEGDPPDSAAMEGFCTRYNRGRKGEDEERLDAKKLKQIIADRKRK